SFFFVPSRATPRIYTLSLHDALPILGGELGQVQFGDEHRRHAVERGAALLLDGLQGGHRVEGGGGDDDAGAVGGGRQVAHDHAEAVVEGHRQTDAVLLAVADGTAHPV